MINNYDSLEHKLFGDTTCMTIKAKDTKEKIPTLHLTFAETLPNAAGGKGKLGDWKDSIQFQLEENTELVNFGFLLLGKQNHLLLSINGGKSALFKRNKVSV